MRSQTFLRFSAIIILQTWFLPSFATPKTADVQSESLKRQWELEEEFGVSISSFLPTASLKDQSTPVSQKCVKDSRLVVKALLNHEKWALSMFHASGKLPVDAMTNFLIAGAKGVLDEPGHFDLCISSKPPSRIFQGQYCSVFLSTIPVTQPLLFNGSASFKQSVDKEIFKNPRMTVATKKWNVFVHDNSTDLIIGFCLPSSCSTHDLQVAIAYEIGRTTFQLKNNPETYILYSLATATHESYCHTENKIQEQSSLDGLSISFFFVVCIIFVLVLTSTIHEIWGWLFPVPNIDKKSSILVKQESTAMRFLQCFSAIRNVNDWIFVKTDAAVDEITCLHGLRVLTILVTILIHTTEVVFVLSRPIEQEKIVQLMSQWIWYPFTNGSVVMENCLLIGGILTCTSLLKDLNRGRFNLSRFYFHRFLRLTPLYSIVLFFMAGLAGRLGSGPYWTAVHYQSEDCRSYWWSHLLYINNIFPTDLTYCMPETWYSAVDMQMFLLSPLFIFPLWRWPRKFGPVLVLLCLLASLLYTMIIYSKWNIPLIIMQTRPSMMKELPKYMQYYYTRTLNRIPAYLIGILLGWVLHKNKMSKITIKKGTVVTSWILSGIIAAMIIYGPFPYVDEKTVPVMNPWFELVYGVFHRALWSAVLAFVIFLCFYGYGGKLNRFLSSKIFVIISRLGYPIYLVNFTVISVYVSYLRTPFNVNLINLIIAFLGMLTFTFILSAFLSICIEMPFRNLEKILLFYPNTPSTLTRNQAEKVFISSNNSSPWTKQKSSKGSKEY